VEKVVSLLPSPLLPQNVWRSMMNQLLKGVELVEELDILGVVLGSRIFWEIEIFS